MDKEQLSFEDVLYEKERQVLFILSELKRAMRSLHYHRTQLTAYVSACGNVKKAVRYAPEVKDAMTASMTWIADLQLELSKEIPSMKQHDWEYFGGKIKDDGLYLLDSDNYSPFTIYDSYIRTYRELSKAMDKYPTIIDNAPLCRRRVEELWKDMQDLGESLEQML